MNNATFFVSVALFVVWMQRHHRFASFFGAMGGSVTLLGGDAITAATGANTVDQAASNISSNLNPNGL